MSQGLVSRDAERSRLTEFLQKALAGETQVCFITGEAGAGKTTLIEEFAPWLKNPGFSQKLGF